MHLDETMQASPDVSVYKSVLIGILLTQLRPYTYLNIRQDLATVTYQALVD